MTLTVESAEVLEDPAPQTPAPRALRDYQSEAVENVERQWNEGTERTSVVLPTGSGKSTVIAKLAANARDQGKRVVMLAHRRELLDQMALTVAAVDPGGEPVGYVIADTDEPEAKIVAASFQTLAKSPARITALGKRDVILVDECHHAMASTYLRVLDGFGLHVTGDLESAHESEVTPGAPGGVRACGFTATMSRADKKKLGKVWHSVALERSLVWAIEEGHLVPPTGKTVRLEGLNQLAKLRTKMGDYAKSDLDPIMGATVPATIEAIQRHAAGKAMIVFAVSIEHADTLSDALNAAGINAAAVVGSHSPSEREESYTAFNEGRLDALVTVQVLTEGADFPRCDTIVLARPTRSQVLYSQMVGRAVRQYTDPATGKAKTEALVLDLVGTIRDTKLATLTDLWGDAKKVVYDADGEEYIEPLPPAPREKKTKKLRDKIELEDYNLLSRAERTPIVYCTTPGGVEFAPSRNGKEAYILWPPEPDNAERVYVLYMDPYGNVVPWAATDGTPLHGTAEQARAAIAGEVVPKGRYISPSSRRAAGRRPSEKQLALAEKLGLPVTRSWTSAQVSDAISGVFTEQHLARHVNLLARLG